VYLLCSRPQKANRTISGHQQMFRTTFDCILGAF
jgi:hypothetical protein